MYLCCGKRTCPPKAPEVVREGNAQVKIYGSPLKGRPRYVIAYRSLDGKRRTRSFTDYNEAKLEAEFPDTTGLELDSPLFSEEFTSYRREGSRVADKVLSCSPKLEW